MKVKIAKGGLKLGTWDHRVISRRSGRGEHYLAIHEVTYDEDGTVRGWTQDPVSITGDTLQELEDTLMRMLRACKKGVLIEKGKKLLYASDRQVHNVPSRPPTAETRAMAQLVEEEVKNAQRAKQ